MPWFFDIINKMYLWDYLKTTEKPIVMYGVGNGAEKIFDCADKYGVKISAIFSSDDHQSNQVFHGFEVESLSSVLNKYNDPIILLAFGSEREEVVSYVEELNKKYELYAPDLPINNGPIITDQYVEGKKDEIEEARTLLSDDDSRNVFDNILRYKSSGKLEYVFSSESDSSEKRSLLKLGNIEHFLDLGAYTGDTIEDFLFWVNGEYSHITALEANHKNFIKLCDNLNDKENISFVNKAAWDKEEKILFAGKDGRNYSMLTDVPGKKKHIKEIDGIAIDSLGIEPSFVKMDIEGAERQALCGMKDTLNRCHPKLMISVYHQTDDFYIIPLLLEKLCAGYKMYLRHLRSVPMWELMLYCVYEE